MRIKGMRIKGMRVKGMKIRSMIRSMKIKSMNMKKKGFPGIALIFTLAFTFTFAFSILPLSLSGCGKPWQEQDSSLEARPDKAGEANSYLEASAVKAGEQDSDLADSAAKAGAQETAETASGIEAVFSKKGEMTAFPERYDKTIGNVTFQMDIVIDANLAEKPAVTAKAQMQKVNQEKAFQFFFSGIEKYDTYDYEEKDEYGNNAHHITYVSPEETTLAYGPQSSKFDYMERDLMSYVRRAFVPFQDERYNADLYSTEAQLPFMNREAAFETVQNALQEIDIEIEADYIGYALDHGTMQSQEHYEDMDGNIDKSQYKAGWSGADDCYYFFINQTYRGLPLYHVYNELFTDATDSNAPIQAVVSEEGIEWLNIEKVFTVSEEQGGILLADMDAIAQAVADKYNQELLASACEMTKAELCYYVDLSSGMGTYDVKPVWMITGNECKGQAGKQIQVIIDAQTAKEIM